MDQHGDTMHMGEGMDAEDAAAAMKADAAIRDAIAKVTGTDQTESRLRAFTLIAKVATEMVGTPVVVTWCDAPGMILQCYADGTVKRMIHDDLPGGEVH